MGERVSDEEARRFLAGGWLGGLTLQRLCADLLDDRVLSEDRRKWIDWHLGMRQDGDACPECGGDLMADAHKPECSVPRLIR